MVGQTDLGYIITQRQSQKASKNGCEMTFTHSHPAFSEILHLKHLSKEHFEISSRATAENIMKYDMRKDNNWNHASMAIINSEF